VGGVEAATEQAQTDGAAVAPAKDIGLVRRPL
jgi:hypothetical protein